MFLFLSTCCVSLLCVTLCLLFGARLSGSRVCTTCKKMNSRFFAVACHTARGPAGVPPPPRVPTASHSAPRGRPTPHRAGATAVTAAASTTHKRARPVCHPAARRRREPPPTAGAGYACGPPRPPAVATTLCRSRAVGTGQRRRPAPPPPLPSASSIPVSLWPWPPLADRAGGRAAVRGSGAAARPTRGGAAARRRGHAAQRRRVRGGGTGGRRAGGRRAQPVTAPSR